MEQPYIADGVGLSERRRITEFVQVESSALEFAQSFFVPQHKSEGFASLLPPIGDVEDGGFDGFFALVFGFNNELRAHYNTKNNVRKYLLQMNWWARFCRLNPTQLIDVKRLRENMR